MARRNIGIGVLQAAYDRVLWLYKQGHRVVCSFSGGKDSTVVLELCIMAARATGRLPVEAILQDEEVGLPGIYKFAEKTAARPEVNLTWLCMQQPLLNIFNRANPYWWCHDPLLHPSEWVRQPPPFAQFVEDKDLELMITSARFPVEHVGKSGEWFGWDKMKKECLVGVIGLRVEESPKRALGLHNSGSYMTNANRLGTFNARPIYDWREGDVWKFISEQKLDYCKTYDTLYKMKAKQLRLGPPTMTAAGLQQLEIGSRAWPRWFDKVATRLPGVRTAVQFGRRTVQPHRRYGETWEDCFRRECLGPDTPEWIRDRSQKVMDTVLSTHSRHSTAPYPEKTPCVECNVLGNWRTLAHAMYGGDPYSMKTISMLKAVEPEFFRVGGGTWD